MDYPITGWDKIYISEALEDYEEQGISKEDIAILNKFFETQGRKLVYSVRHNAYVDGWNESLRRRRGTPEALSSREGIGGQDHTLPK